MNDCVSIIYLTYRVPTNNRAEVCKQCLKSLLDWTLYPYELILIDNTFNNRNISKGRNEGLRMATGKYIAIVDDDILFTGDWLTRCVELVEKGDKYIATPVIQRLIKKWEVEPVDGYRHNLRTGSNCMVMRKSVIDEVGCFDEKQPVGIAGRYYHNQLVRAGYSFLITEKGLAKDLGVSKHSYTYDPIARKKRFLDVREARRKRYYEMTGLAEYAPKC